MSPMVTKGHNFEDIICVEKKNIILGFKAILFILMNDVFLCRFQFVSSYFSFYFYYYFPWPLAQLVWVRLRMFVSYFFCCCFLLSRIMAMQKWVLVCVHGVEMWFKSLKSENLKNPVKRLYICTQWRSLNNVENCFSLPFNFDPKL